MILTLSMIFMELWITLYEISSRRMILAFLYRDLQADRRQRHVREENPQV